MKTNMYYLKEELKKTVEYAEKLTRKIKEEERRTTTAVTRVVIETKYGENCWRSTILAELDLTIDGQKRLIKSLAWLRI